MQTLSNKATLINRDGLIEARAVTVIEVDTEPPTTLLETLRGTPGIIRVLSFEL